MRIGRGNGRNLVLHVGLILVLDLLRVELGMVLQVQLRSVLSIDLNMQKLLMHWLRTLRLHVHLLLSLLLSDIRNHRRWGLRWRVEQSLLQVDTRVVRWCFVRCPTHCKGHSML